MSLLQELSKDLPSDPTLAILEFARRVITQVIEPDDMVGGDSDHRALTLFMIQFVQRFSIEVTLPKLRQEDETDYAWMRDHVLVIINQLQDLGIGTEVGRIISQYERSVDADDSFGTAHLNSDEKRKMQEHIKKMRAIIESSPLSVRKKNALYARLNNLAREVDAHGTRTDQFFAFAGDLAFVLGDMATKAKPFLEEVRETLRVVSRARARQEGVSLPAGDEPLHLPSPDSRQ